MTKKPKQPRMHLNVLYVSSAGRQVVPVVPKGKLVTINGQSWKVTRQHVFPGKGTFDVICVEGQGEAVPVDRASPVSAIEIDGFAYTDYLLQVKALAKGGHSQKVGWVGVGIQVALFLALIIVAVVINGHISDLESLIHQLHQGQAPGQGGDVTTYNPGS